MEDLDDQESVKEINHTWDKLVSSAKKAGYRDGVADGQTEVFQKSFDEGYVEGLRIGFAVAKYKGVLRAKALQKHNFNQTHDDVLENTKRGWCQICKDKQLLKMDTPEIIKYQEGISNGLLEKLHSRYAKLTEVVLQNNL